MKIKVEKGDSKSKKPNKLITEKKKQKKDDRILVYVATDQLPWLAAIEDRPILDIPFGLIKTIVNREIKSIVLFFKDKVSGSKIEKGEIGLLCSIECSTLDFKSRQGSLVIRGLSRVVIKEDVIITDPNIEARALCDILENDSSDCTGEKINELMEKMINILAKNTTNPSVQASLLTTFFQYKPDNDEQLSLFLKEILEKSTKAEAADNLIHFFAQEPDEFSDWLDDIIDRSFEAPIVNKFRHEALKEPNVIKRFESYLGKIFPEICILAEKNFKESLDKLAKRHNCQKETASTENEEIKEYEDKIKKAKLSEEAEKAIQKELKRYKNLNPNGSEHDMSKTYLDTMIEVPWTEKTDDNLDINNAQRILDEDHYGLTKVKDTTIEHLAVHSLNEEAKSKPLCFVGPPGTGKTSIGKSIARATGRKFIRISVGGVRDEAEIRGHRRTYIGSLPGRIIQGLIKAGTSNPVFMLDEIDKLGNDTKGDPASALLEVLDPEQNHDFTDHYLAIGIDISKVMFITTANLLEAIPPALRDRMEVVTFSTYTDEEKFQIAKTFLVPKQVKEAGLEKFNIQFEDDGVYKTIREYVREAGVRNLEREIARVCRKIAKKIAKKDFDARETDNEITIDKLPKYLGTPKFTESGIPKMKPGIAIGLAYTQYGGRTITIEAVKTKGLSNKYKVTGSIGDVMKESLEVIVSYMQSDENKDLIKINESNFEQNMGIHVHIPDGSTPKDGPSAGVSMSAAIFSKYTGKILRNDVAFTGEITLMGSILPVGGLKEKTLAAKKAGIKRIFLPKENMSSIEELEDYIKKGLEFKYVENIKEVLLDETIFQKGKKGKKKEKEENNDDGISTIEGYAEKKEKK